MKKKIIQTKGKKKKAVARLRIRKGAGRVKINGILLDCFGTKGARGMIQEPLILAKEVLGENFAQDLEIDINVGGGGESGQAAACRTAIGRGLVLWSESKDLKNLYLDYDRSLLINDVRQKEPKKYLRKGARAKPTKSYR